MKKHEPTYNVTESYLEACKRWPNKDAQAEKEWQEAVADSRLKEWSEKWRAEAAE